MTENNNGTASMCRSPNKCASGVFTCEHNNNNNNNTNNNNNNNDSSLLMSSLSSSSSCSSPCKILLSSSPEKSALKKKTKTQKSKVITKDMIEKRIEQIEKSQEVLLSSSVPAAAVKNSSSGSSNSGPPVKQKHEGVVSGAKHSELRIKYLQQVNLNAALNRDLQSLQKKIDFLNLDRDQILDEVMKVNEKKTKLDGICDELQKQNKAVLENVRQRGEEEQSKRRELSESFSVTINEVTTKMESQAQERLKMAQENDKLKVQIDKMKTSILAHEAEFVDALKTKDTNLNALRDKLVNVEKQFVDLDAKRQQSASKMESQSKTDKMLREKLHNYGTKFDNFQQTLTLSNPVFLKYKSCMDQLGRKYKAEEGANTNIKLEIHKAEFYIMNETENWSKCKWRIDLVSHENVELQQLCKTLTAQRAALRKPTNATVKEETTFLPVEDVKNDEGGNNN